MGRRALPVAADVTDEASVQAMVQRVVDGLGRIDILVNSAGIVAIKPTIEFPVDEWQQIMDVNLRGTFICCKEVAKVMLTQQQGKIINMSSVRGLQGRANDPAYPASKGAVNLLTKSLAIEWAQQGIQVNAIGPTFIRTDLNASLLDDTSYPRLGTEPHSHGPCRPDLGHLWPGRLFGFACLQFYHRPDHLPGWRLDSSLAMSMSRNQEHWESASSYLPGGVCASARIHKGLGGPFYIARAEGSKIYDLEGNEYIDLCTSFGSTLVGHAHPRVREAVTRSLEMGLLCAYENEYHARLAQRIAEVVPCIEMLRFTLSGTETTHYAVKLARQYTGRRMVVKFEGHFHGFNDHLAYNYWPSPDEVWPRITPAAAGMPQSLQHDCIVLPFNDFEQADRDASSPRP